MRKFLGCCSIFLLASCLNETRVDPAQPETFVRYINGGNHDRARALEMTSDGGYIILANSELKVTATQLLTEKIKLVKVNAYGSVLWSRLIPENSDAGVTGYHANGIYVSDEGYIITGEAIHTGGRKQLLIVETDTEGNKKGGDAGSHFLVSMDSDSASNGSGNKVAGNVSGTAVAKVKENDAADKRFVVLASLDFSNAPGVTVNENMILAEIDLANPPYKVNWDWTYGSGGSSLVNQLFVDKSDVIFGGTITGNDQSDFRLIIAPQNSQGTKGEVTCCEAALSEQASNICKVGTGYAMVGSTEVAGKTDRDILVTRFTSLGTLLGDPLRFPVYLPGSTDDARQDEDGNDICSTDDNGFIILGTTNKPNDAVDKEFFIMKINAFGKREWERALGSRHVDLGVAVTQAKDGGFLILGSTNLANLWTITLIKTDRNGGIE
jgi:hypothetical protein